ncbi:MAG: acyl carrier protein [Flavobacteriales bacterium]
MEIKKFIKNLAEQFEETDPALITEETVYKELEEWDSMIALSVIAMVDEEYDVKISGNDITGSNTVKELFEIIKSR